MQRMNIQWIFLAISTLYPIVQVIPTVTFLGVTAIGEDQYGFAVSPFNTVIL